VSKPTYAKQTGLVLRRIPSAAKFRPPLFPDLTANLIIWTTTEIAVTTMAASIPALRVLLRKSKVLSNRRDYATMASRGITAGSRFEHSQSHKVIITAGGLHEL
jgi:hypothetical protein